jgi:hypothetical protein
MTGKNKGWGFAHFGDRDTMARLLQVWPAAQSPAQPPRVACGAEVTQYWSAVMKGSWACSYRYSRLQPSLFWL